MENLFLRIVNLSIAAGYIVLALLAVRPLTRRLPRWLCAALWALVAIRLLLPESIESVFSLIPSMNTLPENFSYAALPQIESGVAPLDAAVNPALAASSAPFPGASANPSQIWSFLFSRLWLIGMGVMGAYALISWAVLKWRMRTAVRLEKGIFQSERAGSPFVLGVFRPVIYLPFSVAEEDREYIISHERAHIRRRDHWWKPLGFALLAVHWFNPLLWIAYLLFCRDIESACDEKVIASLNHSQRQAYSVALLNCAVHRRGISACPLAFGEVGVKERIKGVMRYKKPAFWLSAAGILLCVVGICCFLTDPPEAEEASAAIQEQKTLTLNDVIILSQKGTGLKPEELKDYLSTGPEFSAEGPGMQVRTFPINELFRLELCEGYTLQYRLVHIPSGAYMDIRTGEVADFISICNRRGSLVCVDVFTNKGMTCLSEPRELAQVLSAMDTLKSTAIPVQDASLYPPEDYYNTLIFTYPDSSTQLHISQDCTYIWTEAEGVFLIDGSEQIRELLTGWTDSVRGEPVAGVPFADIEDPHSWTSRIHSGAVSDVRVYILMNQYREGNVGYTSASSGHMTQSWFRELLGLLNSLPPEAFSPVEASQTTLSGLKLDPLGIGDASIAILDGVNDLAVVLYTHKGTLELAICSSGALLWQEEYRYITQYTRWQVEDDALQLFMDKLIINPPVVTHTVGSEYEWYGPIIYSWEQESLKLYLIEDWIYETVQTEESSGIRIRPQDVEEGWIYFSFWPQGFHPEEGERYYSEGVGHGYVTIRSYPPGELTEQSIWSYYCLHTEHGDYVVQNDGADSWFVEYKDQIEDTISLSRYSFQK